MSARNPRFTFANGHIPRLAITAIGLALSLPQAWAVGFGPLRVQSYLGQPLRAEVDINGVSAEEAQNLAVKLSAPDAYQQAGIQYSPVLSSLRSTLEPRGNGNYVVKLSSTQPATEPFVDVLLDMSWASGKSSRAYTVLLDPADTGSKSSSMPAPVMAPEAAAVSSVQTPIAKPAPSVAAPPSPAPTAAKPTAVAKSTPKPSNTSTDRYTVKSGDSLSSIAQAYATDNTVSLDQMLLAMYRANPNAFIGGNINRLKSGAVLNVPDAAQAQQVNKTTARREISAQTQGFANYRERLANNAAAAKPSASAAAKQQDAGKVTAKVEDKAAPTTTPKDQLKLTKPDAGKAAPVGNAKEEARIAQERATKDAEAKAAQVAKNNADLKKLSELKAAIPGAASSATKPASASATAVQTAPVVPTATSMAVASVASAASPTAASAVAAIGASAAVAVASGASVPATAVASAASKPVVKPAVPTPPVEEPSFLSGLLDNPLTLPGAGLLAALGGAYALVRNRRKRQEQQANPFEHSLLSQESTVMGNNPSTNSLFGTTGGESVDTNQHSIFNTNFNNGGAQQADANEVDPIAEADVYIAYGRDTQAEEILREALASTPERQAIRLKLMEVYAGREDAKAFETVAAEMYSMTKGEGDDWAKAVALGKTIDPNNPLYHGAGGQASVPPSQSSATLDASELTGDLSVADVENHVPPPPPAAQAVFDSLDLNLGDSASGLVTTSPAPTTQHHPDAVNLDDIAHAVEQNAAQHLTSKTAPMAFKLSDVSLDLTDEQRKEAEATMPLPPPSLIMDTGTMSQQGGLSLTEPTGIRMTPAPRSVPTGQPASKDMKTKLDLAMAYVDIGDRDGARELLKEVVEHGDGELRDRANSLLSELT